MISLKAKSLEYVVYNYLIKFGKIKCKLDVANYLSFLTPEQENYLIDNIYKLILGNFKRDNYQVKQSKINNDNN